MEAALCAAHTCSSEDGRVPWTKPYFRPPSPPLGLAPACFGTVPEARVDVRFTKLMLGTPTVWLFRAATFVVQLPSLNRNNPSSRLTEAIHLQPVFSWCQEQSQAGGVVGMQWYARQLSCMEACPGTAGLTLRLAPPDIIRRIQICVPD